MCQIYVKKKRIFAFDNLSSFEKSEGGLCSKDKLYDTSHANGEKNYEHVLNAWKAFKMNIMKKYHDLACVLETFQKQIYKLFLNRFWL